jgi:hypothetical protein
MRNARPDALASPAAHSTARRLSSESSAPTTMGDRRQPRGSRAIAPPTRTLSSHIRMTALLRRIR